MGKDIVSKIKYLAAIWAVLATQMGTPAQAIQVVTGGSNLACQSINLQKELRVFKDPNTLDWENLTEEGPLLTRKGNLKLMKLTDKPITSKTIAILARLHDSHHEGQRRSRAYDTTQVIPVKICGGNTGVDAYSDTLGFVIQGELEDALVADPDLNPGMPPSTAGNPIPKLTTELSQREG